MDKMDIMDRTDRMDKTDRMDLNYNIIFLSKDLNYRYRLFSLHR